MDPARVTTDIKAKNMPARIGLVLTAGGFGSAIEPEQ
jgi:hypothetical protein